MRRAGWVKVKNRNYWRGGTPRRENVQPGDRAGHRSVQTTKLYLHLAGTVFPADAAALEQRLLGGAKLHQTELTSADLSEGEATQQPDSSAD